ncbi:MAG: type I restriction endonuclease subunit R [Alphaproteobacteria bacterium]
MTRLNNIDELNKSELPAAQILSATGWVEATPDLLEQERASRRDVILTERLEGALQHLNPWLSDDNAKKVARQVSQIQAMSLIGANEKLHTMLTYGLSVQQDIGDGQGVKGHTVRFFDFDRFTSNEFTFCRQYAVQNAKGVTCIPDITLFVNGIPLGVIECKSPTVPGAIDKGITQLLRYQELDEAYDGTGMPRLFETVQVMAVMCGTKAKFATVGTPPKFWGEWKKPWPLTLDELRLELGHMPSEQDVLMRGIFTPGNFLDLLRNFIVFEVEGGRSIKKLARYQQFIAVNKAIERIRKNADNPKDRGGVVWHTQGSGKSLTMVYMAMKLRRMPEAENPTLVMVTDRKDLDRQLTDTFTNCGFPNPVRATRISHLIDLLSEHSGKTILTTVQKFGGLTKEMTKAENIFVMVDEAHRTQYKSLAAKMRLALPNASFLGFTGTPIDKKDRSTFSTFGPYIHTYTIKEAVDDGATVPIYYEGRMAEMHVEGQTINAIFERVFKDRDEEERDLIKSKYATEAAIAGAPKRIEQICLDLISHYENHIAPNGFKAQVVAVNRETAVMYKETLDRLGAPESALVMSVTHNDTKKYKDLATPKDKLDSVIEDQFKNPDHPLSILIVCDMLLTGFDAPIEQVMYLDAPLKEHTLLQAIARVNRVREGKNYGLIVDYWGISDNLQKALDMFEVEDVQYAMRPISEALPLLQSRHQAVMTFFHNVSDKNDMEALLSVIEPEDIRAEFDMAFKKFLQSLDNVLPDPAALKYTGSLKWLNDIRSAARTRFRDDTIDLSGCGEKVKEIIEQYVSAHGIKQLVEPISIFSDKFEEHMGSLKSPEAKASEMEHAIRHEITVRLEENPVFYQSLKDRLEKLIEARRRQRIDAAEALKKLQGLMDEVKNVSAQAEELGLNEDQFAVFKILEADNDNQGRTVRDLAVAIMEELEELAVVDWKNKDDVQREMRRKTKRLMRAAGCKDNMEALTNEIITVAKARL